MNLDNPSFQIAVTKEKNPFNTRFKLNMFYFHVYEMVIHRNALSAKLRTNLSTSEMCPPLMQFHLFLIYLMMSSTQRKSLKVQ